MNIGTHWILRTSSMRYRLWVSSCSYPQIYSFHIHVHVPIPFPSRSCSPHGEYPFITSSTFLRTAFVLSSSHVNPCFDVAGWNSKNRLYSKTRSAHADYALISTAPTFFPPIAHRFCLSSLHRRSWRCVWARSSHIHIHDQRSSHFS